MAALLVTAWLVLLGGADSRTGRRQQEEEYSTGWQYPQYQDYWQEEEGWEEGPGLLDSLAASIQTAVSTAKHRY